MHAAVSVTAIAAVVWGCGRVDYAVLAPSDADVGLDSSGVDGTIGDGSITPMDAPDGVVATSACALRYSATRVLHVSTDGSDAAAGTSDAPWATLQHAADTVGPGDAVVIEAGTYAGATLTRGGVEGAPITLCSDGSAHVGALTLVGVGDIAIDGLAFDVPGSSIVIEARAGAPVSRIVIRGNLLVAPVDAAILATDLADSLVEHNTFRARNAIWVSGAAVARVTFRGNDAEVTATSVVIAGGTGMVVDANTLRGGRTGISIDGTRDSVISNNLVVDPTTEGIMLHQSGGAGPTTGVVVANNTVIAPAALYALGARLPGPCIAFNNILVGGTAAIDSVGPGLIASYNVISGPVRIDDAVRTLADWMSMGRGVANLEATPDASALFVDYAARDLHLGAGSIAIDAGVEAISGYSSPPLDHEGNARPARTAFDCGALELP